MRHTEHLAPRRDLPRCRNRHSWQRIPAIRSW